MNAPRKPAEPVAPEKRIKITEIQANVYYGEETPESLLKSALSQFNNTFNSYKNAKISGDWTLAKIEVDKDWDDYETKVTFTGGEIEYDNPGYIHAFKNYNRDVKNYPAKLIQYEQQKIEYDKWEIEYNKQKSKQKVVALQKQIEKAQRELKKLQK